MDLTTTLILVCIGILTEAFFSGSEIGMIAINKIKMKQRAEEGSSSAKTVLDLLRTPEELFATTSLGTNLAMVTSSAVFTPSWFLKLGHSGEWLAIVILFPLVLFCGEIVPKIIFQNQPNAIMLVMVKPLNLFCTVFSPVIGLFTHISSYVTNRVLGPGENTGKTLSATRYGRY